MSDLISRQAAVDLWEKYRPTIAVDAMQYDAELRRLPSAQTEWNNHIVACLLAELFNDTCACNYNSIDEWLPEKCELLDSCPNPAGVACWEQFLKHRAERRTDVVDANDIMRFPTVDAVPVKHGHWKEVGDGWDDIYYECSECGLSWTLNDGTPDENEMFYCPKCGAKMDGERREE